MLYKNCSSIIKLSMRETPTDKLITKLLLEIISKSQ